MNRSLISLVTLALAACNAGPSGPCVAVELKPADLAGSKTLPAGTCYLVKSSLSMTEGTLTVEPGVELRFSTDVGLTVKGNGRLKVNGTAEAPVRFSGADAVVRWKGVHLDDSQGVDNVWSYFEIANAGSSRWTGATYSDSALYLEGTTTVVADHLTLRGSAGSGLLMLEPVTATFSNLVLAGNATTAYVHPEVAHQLPADTAFEANVSDSVKVVFGNNDTVSGTHTWPGFTYQVMDRFYVTGKLSLAPGATLRFAQDASLIVKAGGSLTAGGTAAQPVVFEGQTAAATGFWQGLRFESNEPANRLANTIVRHAGSKVWTGDVESDAALYVDATGRANLETTTVGPGGGYGVHLESATSTLTCTGATFTGNVKGAIWDDDNATLLTGC